MPALLLKEAARVTGPKPVRDGDIQAAGTAPEWLGKFDAIHYRIGRDDVWVIGRLPGNPSIRAPKPSRRG